MSKYSLWINNIETPCTKPIDSQKSDFCFSKREACMYPDINLIMPTPMLCDRRINKTYSYLSTFLPTTNVCCCENNRYSK